jgi:transcriptional regulator with XRE-family HTH domain
VKVTRYLKAVGSNIRKARIRAGLRQVDVTENCGLTYRHYQNIEAGKINLTILTLCRLALAFKVPVRSFLADCDPD